MRSFSCVATVCICVGLCPSSAGAHDHSAAQAEVQQTVESYTAAFNSRDAGKLAEHWSPDAVYTNPLTGNQVTGREAIQEEFKSILASMGETKLEVQVDSIELLSPGVAIEHGTATLFTPEGTPEVSSYSAVHVKQGGKWLLDRVSEEEQQAVAPHHDQLRRLEWMVGSWLDQSGEGQVETTCHWTRNQNYLVRSFKISIEGQIEMTGMQLIGWDAAKDTIRSWAFDSEGGFAEGVWTQRGDRWFIESSSTLPSGERGSAINILKPLDADTIGWQSTGREVGGQILPDIDEVKITRLPTP